MAYRRAFSFRLVLAGLPLFMRLNVAQADPSSNNRMDGYA